MNRLALALPLIGATISRPPSLHAWRFEWVERTAWYHDFPGIAVRATNALTGEKRAMWVRITAPITPERIRTARAHLRSWVAELKEELAR